MVEHDIIIDEFLTERHFVVTGKTRRHLRCSRTKTVNERRIRADPVTAKALFNLIGRRFLLAARRFASPKRIIARNRIKQTPCDRHRAALQLRPALSTVSSRR